VFPFFHGVHQCLKFFAILSPRQKRASHIATINHDLHLDSNENLVGAFGTVYDVRHYAGFHYAGGYANAKKHLKDANARFKTIDAAARPGQPDNTHAVRLFLVAKADIYNREEIFTSYGRRYFAYQK